MIVLRRLAEGLCDGNRADSFVALVGALIMTAERSDMADELYMIAERSIAVARAAAKTAPGSTPVPCPACNAPVFVAGDSDRVDCPDPGCRVALVTARGIDGDPVLRRLDPQPAVLA